ncbi:hypothetical protein BH10BAC2_BH10BAC2_29500 [soil metagenome]
MKKEYKTEIEKLSTVNENAPVYGFVNETEDERLIKEALRPSIEKLQLFTKSLRRNTTLNQMKQNSKRI